VEYERFFSGELKRIPLQSRRNIEATLRRLGQADIERAAERFRLQTIQSRYNSFAELWEKKMQVREEGRTGAIRRPAPVTPPVPETPKPVGKAKTPPPLVISDIASLLAAAEAAVARRTPAPSPAPRPDASPAPSVKPRSRVDLTPLFDRYVAARKALGEDVSRLKYEKFEEAVKKQAEDIRQKTGSSRLVFEVQTADGRVRLVGRPASTGAKG
jgi:hypothetical protein